MVGSQWGIVLQQSIDMLLSEAIEHGQKEKSPIVMVAITAKENSFVVVRAFIILRQS